MVKNFGGNKAKKFARKSVNNISDRSTRYATETGEVYAVVTKMMGNNICQVICIDGKTRLCIIRRKFTGKGKRDNFLVRGKWVLVGLRDWEVVKEDKEKCDLLEVYSDYNKEMLIKNTNEDFQPFIYMFNEDENNDNINVEFNNSAGDADVDAAADAGADADADADADAGADADADVGKQANRDLLDIEEDGDDDDDEDDDDDDEGNVVVNGGVEGWLDYNAKTSSELSEDQVKNISNKFVWIDIDDI